MYYHKYYTLCVGSLMEVVKEGVILGRRKPRASLCLPWWVLSQRSSQPVRSRHTALSEHRIKGTVRCEEKGALHGQHLYSREGKSLLGPSQAVLQAQRNPSN